jgi:hypothetical protein
VAVRSQEQGNSFRVGMNLYGQWRPLLRNIIVEGSEASNESELRMDTCINVSGTYTPRMHDSKLKYGKVGIGYVADKGEGGDFSGNVLKWCGIGVYCYSPGIEPHLNFANNLIDCFSIGMHIDARKFNQIGGNHFTNTCKPTNNYIDFMFDCSVQHMTAANTILSENIFENGENPNRIMIFIGERVADIFIRDNRFDSRGTLLQDNENISNLIVNGNTITDKIDNERLY